MHFNYAIHYLREYLFPKGCGSCGEALLAINDTYYGLCAACRDFLNSDFLLKKQHQKTQWLENIIALFPYRGRFKKILAAYKFGRSIGIGNFFTGFYISAMDRLFHESGENEAVNKLVWVPVPPRPGKKIKQGWDQIDYISRLLEKQYKIPVSRCLKRLPSKSQKELNREERVVNLKGRILCRGKAPDYVVLFDDVITTGSTLEASAKALLESGAKKVYGICLFYD